MQHRVTIQAARIRERDEELGCDRLRVVGYVVACSCGMRGKVRSSVTAARLEGAIHRRATAPAPRSS